MQITFHTMPEALIIKKDEEIIMQNEAYTNILKDCGDSIEEIETKYVFDNELIP